MSPTPNSARGINNANGDARNSIIVHSVAGCLEACCAHVSSSTNPGDMRGGASRVEGLQMGQGMPALHSQPRSLSVHGRSGCASHTQPSPSHRAHAVMVAPDVRFRASTASCVFLRNGAEINHWTPGLSVRERLSSYGANKIAARPFEAVLLRGIERWEFPVAKPFAWASWRHIHIMNDALRPIPIAPAPRRRGSNILARLCLNVAHVFSPCGGIGEAADAGAELQTTADKRQLGEMSPIRRFHRSSASK